MKNIFFLIFLISIIGCKKELRIQRPYTVALLGTLDNPLDPVLRSDVNARTLLNQVCGRLVLINEELALKPYMADSWTISNDNLSYEFLISNNFKFSDGTPVEAKDVKFSIERMQSISDSYAASLTRNIIEVSVPQNNHLRIRLQTPNVRFLYLLAHPRFCVLSQSKPFVKLGEMSVPNSFGDLAFESWDNEKQTLILKKKAKDQLIQVKYLDQKSALSAFNRGEIDDLSFYLLNENEVSGLKNDKKVISTKYYWTWIFEINAKSQIGRDNENRKILLHNFNQEKFVSDWGVEVVPGQSVIPAGVYGSEGTQVLLKKNTNVEFCKKPFSIGIIKGVPNESKLERAIKNSFETAVGCAPKIDWYSMSSFTDEVAKAKDTLYFSAISNRMVDPIEYYRSFISSNSENLLNCSSKEMDKIFGELDQKPLHSRAISDYLKLHKAFLKAACGIPVGYPIFKFVYSSRVNNPINNPIGMDLNFWATNSKLEVGL